MLRLLINLFKYTSAKDKLILSYVETLTGKAPKNLSIYLLALRHASLSKEKLQSVTHSNERLEFLGDAILGAIIAEYLFKKYPFKDEGFLTEIRSRIVNGESLGKLAKKIGLSKFIEYNSRSRGLTSRSSMYGDAMEAFIGAIYLDRGYNFCKKFVLTRIIGTHFDIDEVVNTDVNYKSQLIALAQSFNKKVFFKILEETAIKGYSEFVATALVDQKEICIGQGSSKKRAEQDAARKAIEIINSNKSIFEAPVTLQNLDIEEITEIIIENDIETVMETEIEVEVYKTEFLETTPKEDS